MSTKYQATVDLEKPVTLSKLIQVLGEVEDSYCAAGLTDLRVKYLSSNAEGLSVTVVHGED